MILEAGGNSRFHSFLEQYDLQKEPVAKRYNNKATQFYRVKLKELVENGYYKDPFDWSSIPDKPSYEEGREVLIPHLRTSSLALTRADSNKDETTHTRKSTITISLNDE